MNVSAPFIQRPAATALLCARLVLAGAVHLGDVARVIDPVRNPRTTGLADGKPAVLAIVRRKPSANILKVTDRITRQLPTLRASLPSAMDVAVIVDRANTVRASLHDAEDALALAVVLVALVMLVFLRDIRTAFIASISAPISLIGTLAVMYALGYSLDNLSLMALTIAVGFAVDDAVVVVENIARHLEMGLPPREAARAGAGEIGLTVLSMSMVLVAVFIPLLLMGGYVGLFVREFAVTIAIVVAISLVISLTVVPMLCGWLFPPHPAQRVQPYLGLELRAANAAFLDFTHRAILLGSQPKLLSGYRGPLW